MGLEELVPFFDYAKETGALPANAVHNFSGAVSAISHCLQFNERTLEFVQNNRDLLRVRLATHKPDISPHTIDAYLNRAAVAISHYFSWKKDPERWEKEMTSKPPKKRRKRMGVRPVGEEPAAPAQIPALAAPAKAAPTSVIHIPTEQGKTIVLELPDLLCMNDVLRVLWAAAVHARDFDPETLLKRVGKPVSGDDAFH